VINLLLSAISGYLLSSIIIRGDRKKARNIFQAIQLGSENWVEMVAAYAAWVWIGLSVSIVVDVLIG